LPCSAVRSAARSVRWPRRGCGCGRGSPFRRLSATWLSRPGRRPSRGDGGRRVDLLDRGEVDPRAPARRRRGRRRVRRAPNVPATRRPPDPVADPLQPSRRVDAGRSDLRHGGPLLLAGDGAAGDWIESIPRPAMPGPPGASRASAGRGSPVDGRRSRATTIGATQGGRRRGPGGGGLAGSRVSSAADTHQDGASS